MDAIQKLFEAYKQSRHDGVGLGAHLILEDAERELQRIEHVNNKLVSIINEVIDTLEKDGRFPNAVPAIKDELAAALGDKA